MTAADRNAAAGEFASIDEGVQAMVHVERQIDPDPVRHRRYEEMYQAFAAAYENLSRTGTFETLNRIQC